MFEFAFYDIDTTSCSSLYFANWEIKNVVMRYVRLSLH